MLNAKTYSIRPADTKARKIASLGFGSKNNCFGYLNSSSLSPLNEKFFFALHTLVFKEKYRCLEFVSDNNRLVADVVTASVNGCTATIRLDFELDNFKADCLAEEYRRLFSGEALDKALAKLPKYNHSHAVVIVSYRRADYIGAENPSRYLGEIQRFDFNGLTYYKDAFKSYTVTIG